MPRRPNYGFQKQQKDMKKQKKREEKAEKKRLKSEAAQPGVPAEADTSTDEDS